MKLTTRRVLVIDIEDILAMARTRLISSGPLIPEKVDVVTLHDQRGIQGQQGAMQGTGPFTGVRIEWNEP